MEMTFMGDLFMDTMLLFLVIPLEVVTLLYVLYKFYDSMIDEESAMQIIKN